MTKQYSPNEPRVCGSCNTRLDLPTGAEIEEARLAMGLTRDALGALLGTSGESIRNVERGFSHATTDLCKILKLEGTGTGIKLREAPLAPNIGLLVSAVRLMESVHEEVGLQLEALKMVVRSVKGEE